LKASRTLCAQECKRDGHEKILRFLRFCLHSLIVVVVLGAALIGYFVYTPAPEVPRLSCKLTNGTIEAGSLTVGAETEPGGVVWLDFDSSDEVTS